MTLFISYFLFQLSSDGKPSGVRALSYFLLSYSKPSLFLREGLFFSYGSYHTAVGNRPLEPLRSRRRCFFRSHFFFYLRAREGSGLYRQDSFCFPIHTTLSTKENLLLAWVTAFPKASSKPQEHTCGHKAVALSPGSLAIRLSVSSTSFPV